MLRVLQCPNFKVSALKKKIWPSNLKSHRSNEWAYYFPFSKGIWNIFNRCSSTYSLNLAGVYPPITTSFDTDECITYEKIHLNLKMWEKVPFRGYVVLGSTGEFVSLSKKEKISSVEFVKKNISPDKLVIAGTGCESTKETIELTNLMADAGAHVALIVSPFFYKGRLSEDALYNHYTKVADASKIPVLLYSVPANTNIDLTASLVAKLADHPNIIGLKDSGGDITKIGLIIHQTKTKDFQVLAGSAGFLYSALCVGCVGGVLALANVLGAPVCELHKCFLKGQHNEACSLQHRLIGPNLAVTKKFGIPGVKSAMDMLGYYGGPPRSPLKQLDVAEKNVLREEFLSNGFL